MTRVNKNVMSGLSTTRKALQSNYKSLMALENLLLRVETNQYFNFTLSI